VTLTSPAVLTPSGPVPGDAGDLGYERTIDRRDVHRSAVSEVFLTDARKVDDSRVVLAAVLPVAHAYYGDHTQPGRPVDVLAVLECARQSATWAAHQLLGVPRDATFLVADWRLHAAGGHWPAMPPEPARVQVDVAVTDRQSRAGHVRRARYAIGLRLDGAPLAVVDVSAGYVPREQADLVRRHRRSTSPPLSPALPPLPPGQPVDPPDVFRRDPANVVLLDAECTEDGTGGASRLLARLGTRPDHRGFYEHPQDHYPAMILIEAARQAALLATGGGWRSPRVVTGSAATFHRFAELDAPVLIETVPLPEKERGSGMVAVAFHQGGHVVAQVRARVEQFPREER